MVTVIDGGKIINPKTARNQIEGAIVMGVGMALFEAHTLRSRKLLHRSIATSPTTSSHRTPIIPRMDVTFLDYPDYDLNELGARGVGEIGLAGVAAAITRGRVPRRPACACAICPSEIKDLLA